MVKYVLDVLLWIFVQMYVYLIGYINFFCMILFMNIVLVVQERKVYYFNYGYIFFFENSLVWLCMWYIYNM